MQVNVVFVLADPSALEDLLGHGPRNHVPGGQILGVRGVPLHEPLAQAISQDSSLSSASLCHQTAGPINSSRVELHELQVLHRQALTDDHRASVASASVRGRARLIRAAVASGCEAGVARSDPVNRPVGDVHADYSSKSQTEFSTCRRLGRRKLGPRRSILRRKCNCIRARGRKGCATLRVQFCRQRRSICRPEIIINLLTCPPVPYLRDCPPKALW